MAKLNDVEKQEMIGKTLVGKYVIKSWWRDGGLSSIFNVETLGEAHPELKDENGDVDKIVKIVRLEEQSDSSNNQKAFDELKLFQNHAYNDRHIVNIFDYYVDDKYLYLVIEKIDGESLDDQLQRGKIFTVEETVLLMTQLVRALKLMHTAYGQHPMIHRDIKPQNLIVDSKLKLTLIDFGISTMYDDVRPLTEEADIFCSPQYTSCDLLKLNSNIRVGVAKGDQEQMKRFKEIVTTQLDIHPVGVIMYQMLTGQLPFDGLAKSQLSDMKKIELWKTKDIPIISSWREDVPVTIDNIIYRCTASQDSNKQFRYKDAEELEADLRTCLQDDVIKSAKLLCPAKNRNFENNERDIEPLKDIKKSKIFNRKVVISASLILIICTILAIILSVVYATQ